MHRFAFVIDELSKAGQLSGAPDSWKRQMDRFLVEAESAVREWSARTPREDMRQRLEVLLPSIAAVRSQVGVA